MSLPGVAHRLLAHHQWLSSGLARERGPTATCLRKPVAACRHCGKAKALHRSLRSGAPASQHCIVILTQQVLEPRHCALEERFRTQVSQPAARRGCRGKKEKGKKECREQWPQPVQTGRSKPARCTYQQHMQPHPPPLTLPLVWRHRGRLLLCQHAAQRALQARLQGSNTIRSKASKDGGGA